MKTRNHYTRLLQMGQYLHPIYHSDGDYPQIVKDRVAYRSEKEGFRRSRLPEFTSEQIGLLRGSADFLAVNHYTSNMVRLVEEPEFGEPNNDYDKGYETYLDESWSGSASEWLKVSSNQTTYFE